MLAYDTDLAFVHDAGFLGLAEGAAEAALELLEGCPQGPVLELGCGSGVTAVRLLEAGREVIGWDLSAAMLEIARRRAPEGDFRLRSYIGARPPDRLSMVLAIGEIFNYACDERSGLEALTELARGVHAALEPGGVLLFDSAGPGRGGPEGEARSFRQGEDWAILQATSESSEPPRLTREITTFRRLERSWRRRRETHNLHLFAPAAVREMLEGIGYETEIRRGYDGRRFAPGLDVFVARKG
jgi:SAM-dependent methyltransferase